MSAAAFKEQGNKHLQAKQFDEAIAAYTEAIKLLPTDHVFFSNRSAAYLSKGDASNALKDAEECVKLNEQWAKGYGRKGAALHALRQYDDAVAAYQAGLAVAPADEALKSGLADAEKAKAASQSSGSPFGGGGLFGPQMLAKLAGHPKFGPKLGDPAFMNKLKMVQTNPQLMMSDPELMEVLQVMLGGMGEEDMPEPPSSSALPHSAPPTSSSSAPAREEPKKPEPEPEQDLSEEERVAKKLRLDSTAAKDEGNVFYKNRQFAEALVAYDRALTIDSSNIMVRNNKAAVYIEMGEIDQAVSECQSILDQASQYRLPFDDRAKVYQRIAAARLKQNDTTAAIAAYGKAQMEKYDKAIERKVKNLELELKKQQQQQYINPTLGAEAKERGNAAFREGDFPKAITEYEDAVKRDPTNAAYHNNLAAAYQKMGLFNDAKREVEKSLDIDKRYVKAWAKKGDIEFYMKEYHKSMESYKAGLAIEPDNALCKQGLQKTVSKIQEGNFSGEHDKERAEHAMADPEIQAILMDPTIRQVLQDFQENPKFAQQAMMNDADIRKKIEKLMAAGVLQMK